MSPPGPKPGAKSPQERREEQRLAKLADVDKQVKEGTLVIRQMTPEERKSNPPQPPRPRKS